MSKENPKQITFDIDTKVAEEILGKGYRKIYDDIKRFAKANGFVHIEGSVYMSKKPMSNLDIYQFAEDLIKKYPYMEKCFREIHQADITDRHSISEYFSYDGTAGKYKNFNQKEKPAEEKIPADSEKGQQILTGIFGRKATAERAKEIHSKPSERSKPDKNKGQGIE